MSRTGRTIVASLTAVVLVTAYARLHGHSVPPRFQTATVSTGDVTRRVAATGTLEAVTTAEVGSQVSGTISQLGADFNDIVHKGQVIARLDPSLFDADVESARSSLTKATADVQGGKVAVGDAQVKLTQATALHDRQLIPDSDLETAKVAFDTAKANLEAAVAQEAQARAGLDQAIVNRGHTIITAPIDGIVISRNVDVGQTVAASFQAPTLFIIAADLRKMQLNATIDESDIGLVREGQRVAFTVDAYPEDEFVGQVKQIRIEPLTVNNVVTYSTVIAVDNSDLRLKPGMTATLNVEVARANDVPRVPASALKFIPRKEDFAALGEAVPPAYKEETSRHAASTSIGAPGFLWVYEGRQLRPEKVTLGLSDGALVELRGSAPPEGTTVVTGELVAAAGPIVATPLNPGPPAFRR